MKVILKELRETSICLEIVYLGKVCRSGVKIEKAKKECNELISIFVRSIETAQNNLNQGKK